MTSSPEYPQSSGLGVGRSSKKLLETTKRDGLLSEPPKPKERTLRQGPWFTCIKTIVQQLLKPEAKATTRIKAQLTKKRAVQKHCYDKSSKPLAPLTPSQGQCHRQTDVEKTPSRVSQKSAETHNKNLVKPTSSMYSMLEKYCSEIFSGPKLKKGGCRQTECTVILFDHRVLP